MKNRMKWSWIAVSLGCFLFLSRFAIAQVADAGPDQVVEGGESCQAEVSLDASDTEVPEGETVMYTWTGPFLEGDGTVMGERVTITLPAGEHEIELRVDNSQGGTSTDTVVVTVEDTAPPVVNSVSASPNELWPPNHKMVPVTVSLDVTDNCDEDVLCEIISMESDEPVNGRGDGNTSPDWRINGDLKALVRAERSGPGDGRVYTLTVRCTDESGNETTATTEIRVPHDRGDLDDDDDDETAARTRCVFRIDFRKPQKDRLLAKLDSSDALDQLPEIGLKTIADNVAGYDLELEIGTETISGTFDENGVVEADGLRGRIDSRGFLTIALRGLDLSAILDLDPDDNLRRETVSFPVVATVIPPAGVDGVADRPVVLYDGILECTYSQKARKRGKGKIKKNKGKGGR